MLSTATWKANKRAKMEAAAAATTTTNIKNPKSSKLVLSQTSDGNAENGSSSMTDGAEAADDEDDEDDAWMQLPPMSAPVLRMIFSTDNEMRVIPYNALRYAVNLEANDIEDEDSPVFVVPLPTTFGFMPNYGALTSRSAPMTTLSESSASSSNPNNPDTWRARRIKRIRRTLDDWQHQVETACKPVEMPPTTSWNEAKEAERREQAKQKRMANDSALEKARQEQEEANREAEEMFPFLTPLAPKVEHDAADRALVEVVTAQALAAANQGSAPTLKQKLKRRGAAVAALEIIEDKDRANLLPPLDVDTETVDIDFKYDAFERAYALKTHRHALTPFTSMLLKLINDEVAHIRKFANDKQCKVYVGPLEQEMWENGEVIGRKPIEGLTCPFNDSAEMDDDYKLILERSIPRHYKNSSKPTVVLWGAAGDPVLDMLQGLPFLQIVPAVAKNGNNGIRQDTILSVGHYSVDRNERKAWQDALKSYYTNHYQAQRAMMSRCGMPNCCVSFLHEDPEDCDFSRQGFDLGKFSSELLMQRKIESTTLQVHGIHTRRSWHLFDSVLMLLCDIGAIMKHGSGRYIQRCKSQALCGIRDTTTTATEVLTGVGRKSDLDHRHQFMGSFKSVLMRLEDAALEALYDTYPNHAALIKAYERTPEELRDELLETTVKYKDAQRFSMFGSKAATARQKKPFGPTASMRIHRMLYGLPMPEAKQSKGRTNRKRMRSEEEEDEAVPLDEFD